MTSFPTAVDSFINPTATDEVSVISHSGQHSDINDAVEALETKIGIDNSAVATSLDYLIKTQLNQSVKTTASPTFIMPTVRDIIISNASAGQGLRFGPAANEYANIWTTYGAGDLVIATGMRGSTVADSYLSSYGGSMGRAAIRINAFTGTGGSLHFFTDTDATVAIGGAVTPTERMTIDSDGAVAIGGTPNLTYGKLLIESSVAAHSPTSGTGDLWITNTSATTTHWTGILFSTQGTRHAQIMAGQGSGSNDGVLTFTTREAGGGTFVEHLRIDEAGLVTITGNLNNTGVYKVDGVQVVSNRVVDARCDDAINSGDATTDGVIDALRDAMISHGLIAAA